MPEDANVPKGALAVAPVAARGVCELDSPVAIGLLPRPVRVRLRRGRIRRKLELGKVENVGLVHIHHARRIAAEVGAPMRVRRSDAEQELVRAPTARAKRRGVGGNNHVVEFSGTGVVGSKNELFFGVQVSKKNFKYARAQI